MEDSPKQVSELVPQVPDSASSEDSDESFELPYVGTLSHEHVEPDFYIMKPLGAGGYGKVYRCRGKLDKKFYAIKQIAFDHKKFEETTREVQALAKVDHPNILRYYQSWVAYGTPDLGDVGSQSTDSEENNGHNRSLYVVTELCPRSLKGVLESPTYDPADGPRIFKELVSALEAIHRAGIIHRDVSRDNIFLDGSNTVKLGDFGLACILDGEATEYETTSFGNPSYVAPELLEGKSPITTKIDMFAAGLLLIELLHPMTTDTERRSVFQAIRDAVDVKKAIPPLANDNFRDCCEHLVVHSPTLRWTATEVLTAIKDLC